MFSNVFCLCLGSIPHGATIYETGLIKFFVKPFFI